MGRPPLETEQTLTGSQPKETKEERPKEKTPEEKPDAQEKTPDEPKTRARKRTAMSPGPLDSEESLLEVEDGPSSTDSDAWSESD